MTDNKPKDYLRPEAGPVPYEKLQWRAKKALDKIINTLDAAARGAKAPTRNAPIDTNRASRLFFVSGEPGSGKSTLYLTLREMLSNTKESNRYSEGYSGNVDISALKTAVRWLDPLDLEVVGDEGENLLAAVLVRLIEALSKQDTVSNTILSNPCAEAVKDLEELATGIGIAWEGNLLARAGHLDPDTFSEEVMRTQRERLGVNERLRKVLNKLANDRCYGCGEETLFVLPVDDFYLKPNASLQLLRLLRMISVPRLFFLVMGDITTIEALFIEKSLADWTKVAGAEIFATLPQRQEEALARARELRARYLRKLLPPLQRETIEAMDWDEALKFSPERLDGEEANVPTLGWFLEERKLDKPWGEENPDAPQEPDENNVTNMDDQMSLLTFLLSPPFNQEEKNKVVRKAREAYTALQILDATPREIMDLWFALGNLRSREGKRPSDADNPPELLSVVEEFVRLEIEEQNFLTEEQQTALGSVLPTRRYSARDIQFDMDRLSLEPDPNTWEDPTQVGKEEEPTQVGENQGSKDLSEPRLWVRPHRSWKLAPNTNTGESGEALGLFAKLPPRQTAWIILLHDLAYLWKPESLSENLVKKMLKRIHTWSQSKDKLNTKSKRDKTTKVKEIRLQHLDKLISRLKNNPEEDEKASEQNVDLNPSDDFLGWAVRKKERKYEHLPMPNFDTFSELDRFLFVWSTGFEWLHELWKRANRDEEDAEGAEADARRKRSKAEAVKKQATVSQGQELSDEAKNQVSQAENQASEAEAKAAEKRGNADKAKELVGGDKWIDTYIDLWGLAGWVVINSKYEEVANNNKYVGFARRHSNWFEEQLATFKTNNEVNDKINKSRDWIEKINDFKK